MFFDANVLRALHELRNPNPNPKTIEVTEEELISALKRQGSKDWEVTMTLNFLKMGAALGGNNGERIVLKKPEEKEE